MSKADVTAARVAALSAYTAACEALRVAYIELRACDEAAASRWMSPNDNHHPAVKRFIDNGRGGLPMYPRHAEAAPTWPAEGATEAAVKARFEELRDDILPA